MMKFFGYVLFTLALMAGVASIAYLSNITNSVVTYMQLDTTLLGDGINHTFLSAVSEVVSPCFGSDEKDDAPRSPPRLFPTGCQADSWKNNSQWRTLFPDSQLPLIGKALVAIPIGKSGIETLRKMMKSFGMYPDAFDFMFFAYDDTSWEEEAWFRPQSMTVKRTEGLELKWTLYYDYLLPEVVSPYTHLFLWDDDMEPAPGFDPEVLLHFVQGLDIQMAQPMIRKNSNWMNLQADSSEGPPIHGINMVEIMVPIYAPRTWIECIRARMLRDGGTGYGIDMYLHNYGTCAPDDIYTIRQLLDHSDLRPMQNGSPLQKRAEKEDRLYKTAAKTFGWPPRSGFEKPCYSHDVEVSSNCTLSLAKREKLNIRNVDVFLGNRRGRDRASPATR